MTTLADIRARLRKDLHDTEPDSYRWADSQLDRHIGRALAELSLAIPQEKTASLSTTPGSRDLALSSLAGLLQVETVEFPAGNFPPVYVNFSRWADTLTLIVDTPPCGEAAVVAYTACQTLDDTGTSLPAVIEDLLCTGAAAYAALEQGLFTVDRLNTGGQGRTGLRDVGPCTAHSVHAAPLPVRPRASPAWATALSRRLTAGSISLIADRVRPECRSHAATTAIRPHALNVRPVAGSTARITATTSACGAWPPNRRHRPHGRIAARWSRLP